MEFISCLRGIQEGGRKARNGRHSATGTGIGAEIWSCGPAGAIAERGWLIDSSEHHR